MVADDYIRSLELVLAPHFAPGGLYRGKAGAMRLAREVGFGLRGLEGADDIVQSLYSRLLVRFTFNMGAGGQAFLVTKKRITHKSSVLPP